MKPEKNISDSTLPEADDYITVSVTRKIKPGFEKRYEEWVSGISAESAKFKGHLGVNILRPSSFSNREYTTIYRFNNQENADVWRHSKEHAEWTAKLDGMLEADVKVKTVTGLESWFDLPVVELEKKPNRIRMCFTLTVVVYGLIVILNLLLAPVLEGVNFYLRTFIIVSIQVILMTYLVMPKVTKKFKHWLYQ